MCKKNSILIKIRLVFFDLEKLANLAKIVVDNSSKDMLKVTYLYKTNQTHQNLYLVNGAGQINGRSISKFEGDGD